MPKIVYFILLLCVLDNTSGIIYRLNDTEYEKLPPLTLLDNYGSCLEDAGGTYCFANLELHGTPENKIFTMIQEYSEHYVKHFNYSNIERGVCVTRTCRKYINNTSMNTDHELKLILDECLNEDLNQKYNLSCKLNAFSCERQTDQEIKLDRLDYLLTAVIISLLLAVAIGSYYDATRDHNEDAKLQKGHQALLCFSVFENLNNLKSGKQSNTFFKDLKGLHGVRAITEILVVYAHTGYLIARLGILNPHNFEKAFDYTFYKLAFSCSNLVQIFFSMSGFLMTYFLQEYSKRNKMTLKNILEIVFYRWLRLVPSLSLVILFIVSWFRHLASGPMWKYYIKDKVAAHCRRGYWARIFFFNNYVEDNAFCLVQTWHLAADMQLFIVGLIAHYVVRDRSWRYKVGVLTSLLIIGVAGPTLHIILQNLDGFAMMHPELARTLKDDTFSKFHILGYNNLAGFVVGMANGYFCYYLKQKIVEFPHFKLGNIINWLTIPLLASVFYVGSYAFEDQERPSLLWRISFASGHRIIIGLISSAYIMGVIMKFNGFSKAIMEWDGWVIPSKLSYGVFLVHTLILDYLIASRRHLTPASFDYLYFVFVGVVVFSYIFALILHLLVEAPANRLMKLFTGDIRNKMEMKTQ